MRKTSLGIVATLGVALVVRALGAPPSNGAVTVAEQATHDLGCAVTPSDVSRTKGGGYEVRACGGTSTYGCFVDDDEALRCERDGQREENVVEPGQSNAGMTE